MARMTRQQLSAALATASPRLLQMIEALVQAQAAVTQHMDLHAVGNIELHYAHQQVKVSLTASVGSYKFDV